MASSIKFLLVLTKNCWKIVSKFSRGAVFHMIIRVVWNILSMAVALSKMYNHFEKSRSLKSRGPDKIASSESSNFIVFV